MIKEWDERRDVKITVEADVFGEWRAHMTVGASLNGRPYWMVSHLASGRSIAPLLGNGTDYWTARAIAESIASISALNRKRVHRVADMACMVEAIVAEYVVVEIDP